MHYTAGDILIAVVSFLAALIFFVTRNWPGRRFRPFAYATFAVGLGYTVHSERSNLARWA
jgi:hypothetical protein